MPHNNIGSSGLAETDEVKSLDDSKDEAFSNLGLTIESKLKEAEQARLYDEKR